MAQPQLSIIIPTWNTANVTLRCIDSINKYLHKIPHEIIVIDNCSTDDTLKILRAHKTLKVIKNNSNLGFSKASNQGAKIAASPYLLFLNSDMELIDDSLVSMHQYLTTHPNIGLIGPKFLNPDLTPQGSVFPPQSLINAFKEYWLSLTVFTKYVPPSPSSVWAISGGAILISRQLFSSIHGFDESYFMYFEDLDLCRKIRNRGLEIYYYPQCTVIHRHGQSGLQITDSPNQWRRLVPSSLHYHGFFKHYLLHFVIWTGQKWQKYTK